MGHLQLANKEKIQASPHSGFCRSSQTVACLCVNLGEHRCLFLRTNRLFRPCVRAGVRGLGNRRAERPCARQRALVCVVTHDTRRQASHSHAMI